MFYSWFGLQEKRHSRSDSIELTSFVSHAFQCRLSCNSKPTHEQEKTK